MPPLTQEDFDSATSVRPDVIKMTDAKLNLMLAEGGDEPGKNRFEDKQTNFNPFQQDIEFNNPRVRTRLEDGLFQSNDKTRRGRKYV